MTPQELSLLLLTVGIGAVGQFFLKAGALKLVTIEATHLVGKVWGVMTLPELVLGMMCYGLGAIGLVTLLSRVNLSVVGPAIALSYVCSALIGYAVFREAMPLTRLAGISLIVAGVILVVWKQ